MSETAEANKADPPGCRKRRRWISFLIGAVLLYHIVVPLSYYAGSDETDARFAWRMVSSSPPMRQVDLQRRRIVVTETIGQREQRMERPVPVNSLVTQRWTRFFQRGSRDVIAAFLRWRQQQTKAVTIRMDVKRVESDGSLRQLGSYRLDHDGCLVRTEESAP